MGGCRHQARGKPRTSWSFELLTSPWLPFGGRAAQHRA
jgi:hypothetical protein